MAWNVLFVDDDQYFARHYVRELQAAGFSVKLSSSPSLVSDVLAGDKSINGLVLDLMMPPPEGVGPAETNKGMDTGIWVAKSRSVASVITTRPVPIMFLSNKNPRNVDLKSIGVGPHLVGYSWKAEIGPEQFKNVLDAFLRDAHAKFGSSN